MSNFIASATGILLVVLFTIINLWLSPFWLFILIVGCLLQAIEWRKLAKSWLWLSTGQYAIPWWPWLNE